MSITVTGRQVVLSIRGKVIRYTLASFQEMVGRQVMDAAEAREALLDTFGEMEVRIYG